jgi:hypothetical protein
VPDRTPIDAALDTAREVAAQTTSGGSPSREDLLAIVRRFEGIRFDVPDSPDADGFLFQWSTANWLPRPTFLIGVTRQLETPEEGYLQIAMDFHYDLDADLSAAGSKANWWFRGSGVEFPDWLESVRADPVWELLDGRPIREFAISADEI